MKDNRQIVAEKAQFPRSTLLNSEVIDRCSPDFNDAEALLPLFMCLFQGNISFRFRTPEQTVKAVNFVVFKMLPKLIGCHNIVPWVTAKRIENLVKVSPVFAKIFCRIFRFVPSRPKRRRCNPYNVCDYWIDLDHNCTEATILSLNIFENRNCHIGLLLSVSERQPVEWKSFSQFGPKLVAMQRPLRNRKRGPDWSRTNKYLSFGEKSWESVLWIIT